MSRPPLSVVIPVYNQAAFLEGAVESVLRVSSPEDELIVVDDGSQDETPAVARAFGGRFIYLRLPENLGLAAARNAGIQHATADYVALLDADDEWLAPFPDAMMRLAAAHPDADVLYCGAHCMSAEGADLPQLAGVRTVDSSRLYHTLLRANFILPSTVVLKRSSITRAGLFDPGFRRIQDYELWLRMLKMGMSFVGVADPLVRYRVHDESLSNDVEEGHRAFEALIEKHFGAIEGDTRSWSDERRRIVGGYHRYVAVTVGIRRGDWQRAAKHVAAGLLVDPTLADDIELFYELALGEQPLGWRGSPQNLDANAGIDAVEAIVDRVFTSHADARLNPLRARVRSTACTALAQTTRLAGDRAASRRFLRAAAGARPGLMAGLEWWRALASVTLPRRAARASTAVSIAR